MELPMLALVITAGATITVAVPYLLLGFLYSRSQWNHKPYSQRQCCSSSPLGPALPVSAVAGGPDYYSASWSFYGCACLEKLSLANIAAATTGFFPDNIIGEGSFRFVYRAVLPNGAVVAAKSLSSDGAVGANNREFLAEL